MTDKTKVMAIRVPVSMAEELKKYNLRKLLENIGTLVKFGVIEIVDDEIVMPENTEINLDPFFEVCHDRNIDPQKALDKCVEMLRRE